MSHKGEYLQADELSLAYSEDERRYRSSSFSEEYEVCNQPQLIGHMMMIAHSLEKGLSNDNFEPGHGFWKLEQLARIVELYEDRQYNKKDPGYINSLSIIKEHLKLYSDSKYAKEVDNLLGRSKQSSDFLSALEEGFAGTKQVRLSEKNDNDKKNFATLAEGRSSVRSFSKDPISREDVAEAIRIAQKSPSACNRQSTRIYEINRPELIKEVMIIQEGFSYQTPPQSILLIVSDDNNFSGVGERNQGYVDGGMFAMSLMYALEYKKLAACPLHASFTYDKEQLFRKMLNIADSEKLIVFIAVGNFRKDWTVAKSYRYPVNYITKEVTSIDTNITVNANPKEAEPKETLVKKIKRLIIATKHHLRIRTRVRDILVARKEGKMFFALYRKILILNRNRKNKIYVFGAPYHGNLGDQAQTYCIERWYKKRYPDHSVISIDTMSALARDQYLVNKIRSIIQPGDQVALHSGHHTTDLWELENNLNLLIIETFHDFHITVLPQTIHFESKDKLEQTALVYNEHGDITLMCRDKQSYQTAKKYFSKVKLMLMPDVVTTMIGDSENVAIPVNVNREEGIMMCFRNDKESKHGKDVSMIKQQLSDITNNISQADTTLAIDPYYLGNHRQGMLRKFLSNIAKHKLVITDRYHGTIFSVITNTPVVVLGSTDHKLSSGVKWFSDKCFSDMVYYADSPEDAIKIAHNIYGKYDFSKKIPPVFTEEYWNKVKDIDLGAVTRNE